MFEEVEWDKWINAPGMPPLKPESVPLTITMYTLQSQISITFYTTTLECITLIAFSSSHDFMTSCLLAPASSHHFMFAFRFDTTLADASVALADKWGTVEVYKNNYNYYNYL